MSGYQTRPDGEFFVDSAVNVIPPADTWEKLSVNQLIDVKNELTNKFFFFQNNPAMQKHLQTGIARCDALIAHRLASS